MLIFETHEFYGGFLCVNTVLNYRLSSALQSQVFPMTSLRLYSFTQQQRATLTNIIGFLPLIPFLYTGGVPRPRFL